MQETKEIRELILKELPRIIENDPEVQELILRLSRRRFADKETTDERFDRILNELRETREQQDKKWAENDKWYHEQIEKWKENDTWHREQVEKWNENDRKWHEQFKKLELNDKKWDEQVEKWNENDRKWHEQFKKLELNDKKWDEQVEKWKENDTWHREQVEKWKENDRKWEENQKVIHEMLADIKALSRKHDTTIGALGARWGLNTEQAFRNALKGILEDFAGVEVFHVTEFDDSGQVFGRPDQVELDLIIQNGFLIVAEIKSSVSKAEMYILERKARFYEQLHKRKISRVMIISPMVEAKALPVAKELNIEVYNSAEDVELY